VACHALDEVKVRGAKNRLKAGNNSASKYGRHSGGRCENDEPGGVVGYLCNATKNTLGVFKQPHAGFVQALAGRREPKAITLSRFEQLYAK
jgi:hypothetical protein